jgi:hypothetical protein
VTTKSGRLLILQAYFVPPGHRPGLHGVNVASKIRYICYFLNYSSVFAVGMDRRKTGLLGKRSKGHLIAQWPAHFCGKQSKGHLIAQWPAYFMLHLNFSSSADLHAWSRMVRYICRTEWMNSDLHAWSKTPLKEIQQKNPETNSHKTGIRSILTSKNSQVFVLATCTAQQMRHASNSSYTRTRYCTYHHPTYLTIWNFEKSFSIWHSGWQLTSSITD